MQNTEKPLQIQAFFVPCHSLNVPYLPNNFLHLLIIRFSSFRPLDGIFFLFLLTSLLKFIEKIFRKKCNYYAKPAFHSLRTEKSVLGQSVSAPPQKIHSKNLIDFLWILTKKFSPGNPYTISSLHVFSDWKKMQFWHPKDVSRQNKKNPSTNIE